MKKIFFLFIFFSFVLVPFATFAQEEAKKEAETEVKQEAQKEGANKGGAPGEKDTAVKATEEDSKVKFSPKNSRDPFLSKEEVEKIERNRRAEVERIEKEKRDKEKALIAEREAAKAKLEREAYLKANPHLAIVSKIKIQGMMGSEVQINNDFKGVGDKVAGATITKITGTRIYFKYKGKDFSLPIPKQKD